MNDRYPTPVTPPKGLLFVPDLHLDGRGPSTRVDDYAAHILGKLDYCIQLAKDDALIPVFPGDFFNRAHVQSDLVKTKAIEILRGADYLPIVYPGNHDMSADILGPSDTLWLLKAAGCAWVQIEAGPTAILSMRTPDGRTVKVGVGGTPYGQDLPDTEIWSPDRVSLGVWFTHHNLTFQSHYADRPSYGFSAIGGVHVVINGHLHHAAPEVRVGDTVWHNPGSTTRTKASERGRTPTCGIVWADGAIDILPIPYDGAESVFTSSAGRVSAPLPGAAPDAGARNRFIDALADDTGQEDSVGVLLDRAFDDGRIDRSMRNWLEAVASDAAATLGGR